MRAFIALGTLLFGILVGRFYGAGGLGLFALVQSTVLGGAMISRLGLDTTLIKFVGQNPRSFAVKRYLTWSICAAFSMSLAVSGILFCARLYLEQIFSANGFANLLVVMLCALPAVTLCFILSGFLKGVRKPASACFLEYGGISLISCFILFFLNMENPAIGLLNSAVSFAFASWILLIYGFFVVLLWLDRQTLVFEKMTSKRISPLDFLRTSNMYLTMNVAVFTQSILSILIIGYLLDSKDVGLFRSAERSALLISFSLMVLNSILPPRFSELHSKGNVFALQRLVRSGVYAGLLLSSPMILLCIFFPQFVLGFYGDGFDAADILLRILATAQLVNVMTGSVGFLLAMTGYERIMRNISIGCSCAGLVSLFVLVPWLGAVGAALAMATIWVLQNIVAAAFVWKQLGVWVLPIPKIFCPKKVYSGTRK